MVTCGDNFFVLSQIKLPEGHSAELAALVSHRSQRVVVHIFNPSPWGVETGVIWPDGERNMRREETGAQGSQCNDS